MEGWSNCHLSWIELHWLCQPTKLLTLCHLRGVRWNPSLCEPHVAPLVSDPKSVTLWADKVTQAQSLKLLPRKNDKRKRLHRTWRQSAEFMQACKRNQSGPNKTESTITNYGSKLVIQAAKTSAYKQRPRSCSGRMYQPYLSAAELQISSSKWSSVAGRGGQVAEAEWANTIHINTVVVRKCIYTRIC
jgi:hypothetical protein